MSARLKADSILENSVLDTDAEGAKGDTPQSLRRKDRTFTTTPKMGVVFLLCESFRLSHFCFSGYLSIQLHIYFRIPRERFVMKWGLSTGSPM